NLHALRRESRGATRRKGQVQERAHSQRRRQPHHEDHVPGPRGGSRPDAPGDGRQGRLVPGHRDGRDQEEEV
ncbi:hypothetical protein LTR94_038553, partial [Friedmanniomyces endolithicus]